MLTTQDFLRQAKAMTLSPAERAQGKEFLLHAIQQSRPARRFGIASFKGFTSIIASILIVCIGGTTLSAAAEDSLPGDVLYPVKIHVNERMKTVLARSPEQRASLSAAQAEERLLEAEKLAMRSSLTTQKKEQLSTAFKRHVASLESNLAAVSDKNGEKVLSARQQFKTSLLAHASLLASLDRTPMTLSAAQPQEDTLAGSIEEALVTNEERSIDAQTIAGTSAADTDSLTSAVATVASLKERISEKNMARRASPFVQRRIEAASVALDAALSVQEEPSQAAPLVRAALKNAKEASIALTLNNRGGAPAPSADSGEIADAVMQDIEKELKLTKTVHSRRENQKRSVAAPTPVPVTAGATVPTLETATSSVNADAAADSAEDTENAAVLETAKAALGRRKPDQLPTKKQQEDTKQKLEEPEEKKNPPASSTDKGERKEQKNKASPDGKKKRK